MCGIYGLIELREERRVGEALLTRMGQAVVHRGPDDQGAYTGGPVGIGMRRLSIIDLDGGRQPIPNEDRTVWAVCNGEIYNFRELRSELEARGHVFRCNSDTEVIVHLYEDEGLDLFKRLRGMFAIAVWDAARSRLVVARDRLGKKPLYIAREPHRILFASEIKSILEVSRMKRTMSTPALQEYLALGYVPAPWTLFEGIQKLRPGHYMVVEKGRATEQSFWDVPRGPIEHRSEGEWIESVREKLLECVRVRMVSDVPLGAFLSGGIDSSSIVAAMAGMSDTPVKTYSIGFEGADHFYNELPYARIVANAFKTEHHEIIVRPDIAHLLPKLIWHLDEPIADSAFVTTYLVARLARETVTVILSGVGGDELFGGYRRYLGSPLSRYYNWLPGPLRQKWLPALFSRLPQDRHTRLKNYFRYADAFIKSAADGPALQYMGYVSLFSNDLQKEILKRNPEPAINGFSSRVMQQYLEDQSRAGLNQLIYADLKTSLPDDLLLLTDKMTMAASIECRAPFVDHELVELAASMPDSLKIRGLTMKYLLKKVVAPWLPREIIHRKKRGFGAPMGSWIRRDLLPLMTTLLSEEQVKARGLFNWKAIQQLVLKHQAQTSDCTDQLLALINLELWMQMFLDGSSPADVAQHVASVMAYR